MFETTLRNRVKRLPERANYDKETVYQIIDAALIGNVAFTADDQPFVIPTLIARDGDALLLHGAPASRLIRHIQRGDPICVSITHVDGIVLAKAAFHHSINYRSVVLFGTGRVIESDAEKMRALEIFTERILPGRWDAVRLPNAKELNQTTAVAVPIELASAKIRTGGPKDDEEDKSLPIWSGVVPLQQIALDPISAESLVVPEHVKNFVRSKSQVR